MQSWLIEPRDGLAFRDGRPNSGGSESRSLRFPLPQTIAGAVRSRAGTDAEGRFDIEKREAVLALTIHGPLLVRTKAHGWGLLAQAPQDALWEEAEGQMQLHHLHPVQQELRGGTAPEGMDLVGLETPPKGKPPKDVPTFWTWEHLMGWLQQPGQADAQAIHAKGEGALIQEERMSVAIDPETNTYKHSALFGVSNLVFHTSKNRLQEVQDLGLYFCTDAHRHSNVNLQPGMGFLGGKNKVASFHQAGAPEWPGQCPFLEALAKDSRLRVMLLTPGLFTEGWKPSWLLEPRHGITPILKAARVDRPETFSGWDFDATNWDGRRGAPKKSRRAVSSGAVYWLELGGTPEQRKAWIQELWMKPVSDDDQDRRDGFGLAVMGVWA